MENKLEQLLNSLVSKGWKPRNVISKNTYIYKVKDKINLSYSEFLEDEWEVMHEDEWYSLRDLVSKSSWLWQFVCENKLVKRTPTMWERYNADTGKKYGFYDDHSTYRLIESALKDESELEDFLLQNIKVWNN